MRYYAKLNENTLNQLDDNFSIELEINKIGRFSYIVSNDSENRSVINDNITSDFEIYRASDDLLIFKGKITDLVYEDRKQLRVEGLAHYVDLSWRIYSSGGSYRVEYNNVEANTILSDVLSGTGYTISSCPSDLISLRGEYESKLRWVAAIAKALTWTDGGGNSYEYEFDINTSNQVSIVQKLGSNKGDITSYLTTFEKTESYGDLSNHIIGLGYGEGLNQISSEASDSTSITNYGQRDNVFSDKRILYQSALDDKTNKILAKQKDPVKKYQASVLTDYFLDNLTLGDEVTINLSEWQTSDTLRIVRATIGPHETELVLSNQIPELSGILADLKDQMDVTNAYMQGATNVSNFGGGWQALDSSHPAKWVFYLPDSDVGFVRVNECFVSIRGRAYRIWSKGAASGGGTTVSSLSGGGTTATSSSGGGSIVSSSSGGEITVSSLSGGGSIISSSSGGEITVSSLSGGGSIISSSSGGGTTATSSSGGGTTVTSENGGETTVTNSTSVAGTGDPDPSHTTYAYGYNDETTGHRHIVWFWPHRHDIDIPGHTHDVTIPNHTHNVDIPNHTHDVSIPDHTHDVSIPSHIHEVDVPNHTHDVSIPSHTHNVGIPNHTHSVNIPNHTHSVNIPSHTHTPEAGIYETTDYPSNVVAKITNSAYTGQQIASISGGSSFDEEKIDITQYVRPGKNEIEITSNTLGMVQVDGFYRIFIKTK